MSFLVDFCFSNYSGKREKREREKRRERFEVVYTSSAYFFEKHKEQESFWICGVTHSKRRMGRE